MDPYLTPYGHPSCSPSVVRGISGAPLRTDCRGTYAEAVAACEGLSYTTDGKPRYPLEAFSLLPIITTGWCARPRRCRRADDP
eukprot:759219-Prorocentrum_minimum.AAC.1